MYPAKNPSIKMSENTKNLLYAKLLSFLSNGAKVTCDAVVNRDARVCLSKAREARYQDSVNEARTLSAERTVAATKTGADNIARITIM